MNMESSRTAASPHALFQQLGEGRGCCVLLDVCTCCSHTANGRSGLS